MLNSVKAALKHCSKNLFRKPFLTPKMISERRYTSKPPTDPALTDSSKVFIRAIQDIVSSNEVKLMRLTAMKVYNKSYSLFQKHVLLNPKFQASLSTLKSKVEEAKLTKSKEADKNPVVEKVTKSIETSEKPAVK